MQAAGPDLWTTSRPGGCALVERQAAEGQAAAVSPRDVYARAGLLAHTLLLPAVVATLRVLRSRRTRVVLHDADGRVALVRGWFSQQRWELPGGGLGRAEAPAEGAARELAEEIGVELAASALRLLDERPDPRRAFTAVLLSGRLPGRAALVVPRGHRWEVLEAAWHDPAALPDDVDPLVRPALEAAARDEGPS